MNFCENCPTRRALILNMSRAFGASFEALPGVQMRQTWACWKDLDVYFPTQVECLNLVAIFPSKIAISQDCFLCVKKVAESHFLLFFDLLEAQNLVKFLGNCWASVFLHEKSKNAEFSWKGVAHLQGSARRAMRWVGKPVFAQKIHKRPKMLKFFWNLCCR